MILKRFVVYMDIEDLHLHKIIIINLKAGHKNPAFLGLSFG